MVLISGIVTENEDGVFIRCTQIEPKPEVEQKSGFSINEKFQFDNIEDVSGIVSDNLSYLPSQGYQVLLNDDSKSKIEHIEKN